MHLLYTHPALSSNLLALAEATRLILLNRTKMRHLSRYFALNYETDLSPDNMRDLNDRSDGISCRLQYEYPQCDKDQEENCKI